MPSFTKSSDLRNIFLIGSATLLMVFLFGQIAYAREPYASTDLAAYRSIAQAAPQLDLSLHQPFAFRLLGPYLIGLLPIPDPIGFYIASIIASFCLVFLFYFFLLKMGVDPDISALTVILFVFNKYLFGFTVWDFFQINDILSLIFLILLFLAMMRKQWLLFAGAFFLGALARETVMLMIPVACVYLLEKRCFSSEAGKLLLALLPGIAVFFAMRIWIPVAGNNLVQAFLIFSTKLRSPEHWFRLLINPFIPLSLLPLIFFRHTREFFRTRLYALLFLALVFISTLFGSNDERLMAPAFFVFYWLIAEILQKGNSLGKRWWLLVIGIVTFISSFHYEIARYPVLNFPQSVILSLICLVLVSAAVILCQLRFANQGNR